jgi:type III secretion protein V
MRGSDATFAPEVQPRRTPPSAEIALAIGVLATIAMMIVPLPTPLLDILIATNLSASFAVLLVVLYAPNALSVASFPTVLLLTTLFRLALNVSSTRLVLLQGNAGTIIRAFGGFVVRGNYVVGAVVFLVLAIIQFLVIAKGAERIAEVGARFVLDAMPGKQMAIDAEVRAGTLDVHAARAARQLLARESQFFGAMDGAMKFVKGDVIASLVIAVINVVGGLAIGVAQKGMPVTDALKRYGLLAIGDALVSQIPALVLSTAAGLLVTRVASTDGPSTSLGDELASEWLGQPKALTIAAVFVLVLGVVPGLPALPFLLLAAGLFVAAKAAKREPHGGAPQVASVHASSGVQAVRIEFSRDLNSLVNPGKTASSVHEMLREANDRVYQELGVVIPNGSVVVSSTLTPRTVVLSIFEVPAHTLLLPEGMDAARAKSFIADACTALLRTRAADFLGLSETQRSLDQLERTCPALVRNVVPRAVSLALLTDILRRLVAEYASIRDMKAIIEALASVDSDERDVVHLTELVRARLKRALTYRLTEGALHVDVVTLDPIIEDTLRRALPRTKGGALVLAPASARDLVASVKRALSEADAAGGVHKKVLLTAADIRPHLRKLIEHTAPDVYVVSTAELVADLTLRPIARAHLGGIGD